MSAQIIVIDFDSLIDEDKAFSPSVKAKVDQWIKDGSTVYFVAGRARDAFRRQQIERVLEANEIKSSFVSHSLPDRFDLFVSRRILKYPFE